MGWPEETIGNCRLILGDCREVLPTLGPVDAVVTDPPYGIGTSGYWNGDPERWHRPVAKDYGRVSWDDQPPSEEEIQAIRVASKFQILFGGNYFPGLPARACWLIWDKEQTRNFADCEMAWTNLAKPVQKLTYLWGGFRKAHPEERFHPTQKPVAVMAWCLDQLPLECHVICDPYMGSGSIGIAAVSRGKAYIGIERLPAYFDIACRRIADVYAQPDFFVSTSPVSSRPQQLSLGVW